LDILYNRRNVNGFLTCWTPRYRMVVRAL